MIVKKIVFATGNPNKLKEIKAAINSFEIIGLKDLGIIEEIPETGATFKENALIKAKYVYDKAGVNCFSDDTGLEIEALDNGPGVYSAMYAGEDCNAEANMQKVLKELEDEWQNRNSGGVLPELFVHVHALVHAHVHVHAHMSTRTSAQITHAYMNTCTQVH